MALHTDPTELLWLCSMGVHRNLSLTETDKHRCVHVKKIMDLGVVMILPQVHLRKPCYDFTFL